MVICLELGAYLHMAQLVPLPLTVSCFSKIQIGFTFLVSAHPGSPGQRAVKRMYVCILVIKIPQIVVVVAAVIFTVNVSYDLSYPYLSVLSSAEYDVLYMWGYFLMVCARISYQHLFTLQTYF